MRTSNWIITAALAGALSFGACTVEQTREGEMPDVDVAAEAGRLPAYDIDGPDVDVGVREKTVEVPKIRFETERESVTVPFIDIDLPGDDDMGRAERELAIEFDVDQGRYEVEIEEIRARGDRLFVIAELKGDADEAGASRVSDRVVVRAPDADVRYYVIGERPAGAAAARYTFVSNRAALPEIVRNAKVIYNS